MEPEQDNVETETEQEEQPEGEGDLPPRSEADIERERDKTWVRMYSFTEDQLTELKEVFAMFDRDDSNTICAPDLGTALRAMGQNPTEAEVAEMLQEANLDDSGQMGLDEFMRIVGSRGLKTEGDMEEEFEEALRVFDKDGMGLIDASDLKSAMRSFGEPIDDDDIAEMLKVAEVGGDGKIDYMDFMRKVIAK